MFNLNKELSFGLSTMDFGLNKTKTLLTITRSTIFNLKQETQNQKLKTLYLILKTN